MVSIAGRELEPNPFDYLDLDQPGEEILAVIGPLPKRWGRMDRLSRLAVCEVGRALREAGLSRYESSEPGALCNGGLIGAGRHGSLITDLAYARTLEGGLDLASPTLFSYTLPNIALAEAASHYGLTGPVYALFSADMAETEAEACRWLAEESGSEFMVAGLLDICPAGVADPSCEGGEEVISVNFKVVRRTCPT